MELLDSFSGFLDEMAKSYAVGEIAAGIGDPSGAALKEATAQAAGLVAYDKGLGFDFFETGAGAGATLGSRITAASKWLRTTAGKWLQTASKNIPLILAVGGVVTAYAWATSGEREAIEEVRAKRAVAEEAIKANPDKAAKIAEVFGSQIGGMSFGTVLLIGGVVVGGVLLLRYLK